MAKSARKSKSKPNPAETAYTIKHLDRVLWESFTAKCEKNGRRVRAVVLKMVTAYANGEFQISD